MADNDGSGLFKAYQMMKTIGGKFSKPEPQKPAKKKKPRKLNTLKASRDRMERAARISRGLEEF